MRQDHRVPSARVCLLSGLAFALALTPSAGAERKAKPKPATQADIERLEQRLEEQQRLLASLGQLQLDYQRALTALFDGTPVPPGSERPAALATNPAPPTAPTAPTAPEPRGDAPRPVSAATVAPKAVKPVPVKKPDGFGTVVGKVAGAADAIVYVDLVGAPSRGTATMKQEGKQFAPGVLVVPRGTTVEFPNRDAIFHNVFSVTPDHSFDLGSYRQGESKKVTMAKPGVVTVFCNMHPQMVGHILVTPNANFVRAGKDGFFRLTNVPAGQRRIVAWAPNAKPTVVQTNVVDAEVVTVELTVKKGRSGPHARKDGMPYGSYDK